MTIPEYLYSRLISEGCTHAGACAVLGNVQAESGFITNNLQDTFNRSLGISDEEFTRRVDAGDDDLFYTPDLGYGLHQVTYAPRKKKFLRFMRNRSASIADAYGQTAFIILEFKEDFASLWKLICTSDDLYYCTDKLLEIWENPKFKNYEERRNFAQKWYTKFLNYENKVVSNVTQNEAIEMVLDLARSEIGYHEQGDNITKYAAELDQTNWYNGHKNGFAWCDMYVDWLFYKCFGDPLGREMICQPTSSAGAGCLYSAQYYKQAGRWFSQPQPGDQIFFSYAAGEYSHTGIVEFVENGMVHTIEGNTSDMVARRSYALASGSIVGYGRPRWELADGEYIPQQQDEQPISDSANTGYEILRKGSKGIDVRKMQEKLIKLGFDLGSYGADGDFGSATLSAVKAFQKKYGLEADGEAGPLTLKALNEAIEKLSQGTIITADSEKQFFAIGDVVYSRASVYYSKPDGGSQTYCHSGKALVIGLSKSSRYPYQLCKINGGGSNVYGWVAKNMVEAI